MGKQMLAPPQVPCWSLVKRGAGQVHERGAEATAAQTGGRGKELPILKMKKLRPREVRRPEGCWKDDRIRMQGKHPPPHQAEQRTSRNRGRGGY